MVPVYEGEDNATTKERSESALSQPVTKPGGTESRKVKYYKCTAAMEDTMTTLRKMTNEIHPAKQVIGPVSTTMRIIA